MCITIECFKEAYYAALMMKQISMLVFKYAAQHD